MGLELESGLLIALALLPLGVGPLPQVYGIGDRKPPYPVWGGVSSQPGQGAGPGGRDGPRVLR